MRETILDNLTRPRDPGRRVGEVVKPLGGGWYQVRDDGGRLLDVGSDAGSSWQPGDGVAVEGGRIVGRAARLSATKVFEV